MSFKDELNLPAAASFPFILAGHCLTDVTWLCLCKQTPAALYNLPAFLVGDPLQG
jgi:hypothetical protein